MYLYGDESEFEASVLEDLLDVYEPMSGFEGPGRLPTMNDPYRKSYCKKCAHVHPPSGLNPGDLTNPDRCGGRWFVPKYRQNPSNIWSLARYVQAQMSAEPVPSRTEIRQRIKAHPCNAHFRGNNYMFMPRFKENRVSLGGRHYGAIYIPWRF